MDSICLSKDTWNKIANEDEYSFEDSPLYEQVIIEKENEDEEIEPFLTFACTEFLNVLFGKGKIKAMLDYNKNEKNEN